MKGATSIQERLWELRKDKGLNLEELSKLTGISKSALGSYEKEDFKEINHGNLITLADFYGVSVDYLLCRIENREQINTPLTELHLNDEMDADLKKEFQQKIHDLGMELIKVLDNGFDGGLYAHEVPLREPPRTCPLCPAP